MDNPIEIKIVGDSAGLIHLSPALPSVFGSQRIPGIRCLEAKGAFGHLLFQEIAGEGFSVWHYSFFLNKDDRLTLTWGSPVLRLWLALKCSFYYSTGSSAEQALHERGFHIQYAPELRQTIRLRGRQPYVCIDIRFSPSSFRDLASSFLGVEEFLQAVEKQQRSQLTAVNWVAGLEMLNAIDDILYCRYTSAIRTKYLTCKVMEVLFLARDYSLRELGVLVGLSSYHLKRGFKAIYNLTAADFRHEIRMQKARLLLEETDLPITRIAIDIGYDHPFAFSSAFKKFFGYTPSLVRKGRRMHTD